MTNCATFLDVAKRMIKDDLQDFRSYITADRCKMRGNYANNTLYIHYIFVPEALRDTGLLRDFLQQVHTLNVHKVAILAVQSDVLDSYLQRFVCPTTGAKFKCYGADFVLQLK